MESPWKKVRMSREEAVRGRFWRRMMTLMTTQVLASSSLVNQFVGVGWWG
jgi:hypothetical protein